MTVSANMEIELKRELIFAIHADLNPLEFLTKAKDALVSVCNASAINFIETKEVQLLSYGRWAGQDVAIEPRHFRSTDLVSLLKSTDSVLKCLPELFEFPIENSLVVPILTKNEIAGCIALGFVRQNELSATQIHFAEDVALCLAIYKQQERLAETIKELSVDRSGTGVTNSKLEGITEDILSEVNQSFNCILLAIYEAPDKKQSQDLMAALESAKRILNTSPESTSVGREKDVDINAILSDVLAEVKEILAERRAISAIKFAAPARELVICDKKLVRKMIHQVLLFVINMGCKDVSIDSTSTGHNLNVVISLDQDIEVNFPFKILLLLLQQCGCETEYLNRRLQLSFQKLSFSVPKEVSNKSEKRLMVVDDDDSLRELMLDILESRNYKVVCCSDGRIALSLFHKGEFDMLITDLGLPHVSGSQLAAQVKAIDPSIPIIMMTGWGADAYDKEVNQSVDYVLSKPFNLSEFLATIEIGIQSHV